MAETTETGGNSEFRSFGLSKEPIAPIAPKTQNKTLLTVESIRNNVIGAYSKFDGPFGEKPIVYADWTASGRPVAKIENYLLNEVMPLYGNTHTTTSISGHQSTCFRHEARQIVAESVNAKVTGKAAVDVVIFTGNGTTAAVKKLVTALGLHLPFPAGTDESLRPIVFTSSYEHHSNLLPWRESDADVVTIAYSPVTGVCLTDLERQLKLYQHRKVKIGTFSAASNVTGVLTAVDAVSILMHLFGGLALFDYATAAPYVAIDMNPTIATIAPGTNPQHFNLAYKDAIFFSGHKFLGGPGCPGVLIVKRRLMPQSYDTPTTVGGGTVFYVTEEHHRYLSNREEREEGGTPEILGDVKLGLAMHLKQSVGAQWIQSEELRISEYVQQRLQKEGGEGVVLLGRDQVGDHTVSGHGHGHGHNYLPVFSFLIRCADRFLHFHYVCVLLNDLFGIQSRGGCMCAGPFSQLLLGLDEKHNQAVELALLEKHEVLRPGYTRLSFPYWTSTEEVDFVVDAILFVAKHGWKFLHMYRYNHKTGEWAHSTRFTKFPERKWLSNFDITASAPSAPVTVVDDSAAAIVGASAGGVVVDTATTVSAESSSSLSSSPMSENLKVWEVSNASELFAAVKRSAEVELSKVNKTIERANGKKQNAVYQNTQQASTAAVSGANDLASFEYLRWFVVPEETSKPHYNPAVTATLKGVLNPATDMSALSRAMNAAATTADAIEQQQASDTVQTATADAAAAPNAYSAMRDNKMKAHTGEVKLPRYLQLIDKHAAAAGGGAAVEASIVDVLIKAAVHPLSTSAVATPAPVPAAHTVSKPAVVVESSVLEKPLSECSLGECAPRTTPVVPTTVFLPPSTDPASTTTAAAATAVTHAGSGKVLSGPGITYTAHPSMVSVGHTTATEGGAADSVSAVQSGGRQPKPKQIQVPKRIMKAVGNAVKEWNMIEEGDRLLLGLSGGKDSLAMLHTLLALQKRAPVRFEIACATVDPQTSSFDPSPMIPYVQSLGITYHYLSEPIVELAKTKLQGDSLCAFCSRFKRGLLYSCCRNNGYNKLVLAQHLDDLVESFLMSALHNGQIRTMKANYKIEAGDVNVIRPFVYVREYMTKEFSQSVGLPIINENCPACFEEPKERDRMKKLLIQEEAMIPALFFNFKRALLPLMHEETYEAMARVAALVDANAFKSNDRPNIVSSKRVNGVTGNDNRTNNKNNKKEEKVVVDSGVKENEDDDVVDVSVLINRTADSETKNDNDATAVKDDDDEENTGEKSGAEKVHIAHSDAIVEGILNAPATCEPGGFCTPCYELA